MRKYSTPREVLNAHITSEEFMNLVCNYAEKIPPQRGGDGMSDLDKENIFLRNTSTKNFFTLLYINGNL